MTLNPLKNLRIGIGHDTHRLKSPGPLLLGGVTIEFDYSLDGHSDADALLHAVTDAILGAAAMGDIGEMFPDTAAENAGRDSGQLLQLAWEKVQAAGYSIINLDSIVFAQKPKLSAYKLPMEQNIARLLQIASDQVGVKAKTGEGVGPIGTGQIISTQCVALLLKEDSSKS